MLIVAGGNLRAPDLNDCPVNSFTYSNNKKKIDELHHFKIEFIL